MTLESGIEVVFRGRECFDLEEFWRIVPGVEEQPDDLIEVDEKFCQATGIEPQLNGILGHGFLTLSTPPLFGGGEVYSGGCQYNVALDRAAEIPDANSVLAEGLWVVWMVDGVRSQIPYGDLLNQVYGGSGTTSEIEDLGSHAVLYEEGSGTTALAVQGEAGVTVLLRATFSASQGELAKATKGQMMEWGRKALAVAETLASQVPKASPDCGRADEVAAALYSNSPDAFTLLYALANDYFEGNDGATYGWMYETCGYAFE